MKTSFVSNARRTFSLIAIACSAIACGGVQGPGGSPALPPDCVVAVDPSMRAADVAQFLERAMRADACGLNGTGLRAELYAIEGGSRPRALYRAVE